MNDGKPILSAVEIIEIPHAYVDITAMFVDRNGESVSLLVAVIVVSVIAVVAIIAGVILYIKLRAANKSL